MSDGWAGISPPVCNFAGELQRNLGSRTSIICATMSEKCQDDGGGSLDGGASSLRMVGDTGGRLRPLSLGWENENDSLCKEGRFRQSVLHVTTAVEIAKTAP